MHFLARQGLGFLQQRTHQTAGQKLLHDAFGFHFLQSGQTFRVTAVVEGRVAILRRRNAAACVRSATTKLKRKFSFRQKASVPNTKSRFYPVFPVTTKKGISGLNSIIWWSKVPGTAKFGNFVK
uniref:Uncharacterized protein n=1 Tax=Romanomermis culicivorax TaxID=13658 RepID=A0A915IU06_ROMCU